MGFRAKKDVFYLNLTGRKIIIDSFHQIWMRLPLPTSKQFPYIADLPGCFNKAAT